MDALQIQEANDVVHASRRPGFMHACGHDGHTAMLLGAAQTLATLENLDAVVHFIFQPAEEHGIGARRMIEDGLFDRFDIEEIYALHNLPGLKVGTLATRAGPIMASEDNFTITLDGTGGHAARPHLCNDLIVAGSELVLALQTIVARRVDPVTPAVVSVTEFITDGTRNALPSCCVVRGDTRSYEPEVQRIIETEMRRIADGVASVHGLHANVTYTHEFVATCNHVAATERAARAGSAVAGATVIVNCDPLMMSDDFGVMLREKPGNYAFLGNGEHRTAGAEPLHSSRYDFNDAALPFGVQYFVELARQGASDR